MTQARPDPKPPARRNDRAACKAKVRREAKCRRCGRVPSGHHLDSLNFAHLLRGKYREWVPEAGIPLCGSGTTGDHFAFDNDVDVRREMWPRLTDEERAYVISRVGHSHAAHLFGLPVPA